MKIFWQNDVILASKCRQIEFFNVAFVYHFLICDHLKKPRIVRDFLIFDGITSRN